MKKFALSCKLNKIVSNKKILGVLVLLVITASAVGSYFFFLKQSQAEQAALAVQKEIKLEEPDLGVAPEDLTELNILLLGYGGPGHDGPYLTDAIQILHLDFEDAKVGLISIPRDLWVELPNGQQAKINQALTLAPDRSNLVMSGSKVAKQMAQTVTGVKIHYFIGADFVGFKRAIGGTLGGITVDVPEELNDPWYPIRGEELNPCDYSPEEIAELTAQYSGFELEKHFECRYQHVRFKVGPNQMEGSDALAYVRSRHGSAGGDFSRSKRQQALLKGVRDKLFSMEVLKNIPDFHQDIAQHIVTDLDLELIKYLAPALKNAFKFEVKEVVINTENVLTTGTVGRQFVVMPKAGNNEWSQVQEYVRQELENY